MIFILNLSIFIFNILPPLQKKPEKGINARFFW